MLEVNIRSAGYEIGEKTIHDIAFSIEKGELVALLAQMVPEKVRRLKQC